MGTALVAAFFVITDMHPVVAQHPEEHAMERNDVHQMWMTNLGGGWHLMGMGQIYPLVTFGAPFNDESGLQRTRFYPTQSVAMFNLESPGSRFVLRVTPNFEGLTLPDGETTLGGWGEGFIDARHPHTILHEAMASVNFWNVGGGMLSFSAGKGFVPYGTDDPMARPVQKFPTNHHLSQLLERWTVNGVFLFDGWNLEGAVFGGDEPEDPYDFTNIRNFPNSWAVRAGRRFGPGGTGVMAPWEMTASFARVFEEHDGLIDRSHLYNIALRHDQTYGFGRLYALVEGSISTTEFDWNGAGRPIAIPAVRVENYWAMLAETQIVTGPHQPYYRIEWATRPEYSRDGSPGTDGFFRYHHGERPVGATRWLINSVGYNHTLTGYPFIIRPFVEVQHNLVRHERGPVDTQTLFGGDNFWAFSVGVRLFFGGDQMRMGTYGVLDPMTAMHRVHEEMPHHPHPEHPPHHMMPHPEMDHHAMHRGMEFFVRLLEDPEVERRVHADHRLHELWEDPAVQRHLEMMRHAVETGEMPEHEMMDREGMHRAMEMLVRLLDDPQVQARIHADPELHRLFEDDGVQRHILMMREMHGDEVEPVQHEHQHE